MLGADIADLGYPENYCILEEYSLQLILQDVKQKGIIKNIQFISASGEAKAASFIENIQAIENLNTLIKCNPYYFNKYLVVLDNYQSLEPSLKARLNNIKSKLGLRFIELQKKSLEEYYEDFENTIDQDAIQKLSQESNHKRKGAIKAEMARLISEKIITGDDFQKLFANELNSLLKDG